MLQFDAIIFTDCTSSLGAFMAAVAASWVLPGVAPVGALVGFPGTTGEVPLAPVIAVVPGEGAVPCVVVTPGTEGWVPPIAANLPEIST